MRVIFNTVIYIAMLAMLSSCVKVKFDYDDNELILVTNWDDRSDGIPIPASYIVQINGTETTFSNPINVLTLDNGEYNVLVYNTADKVEITGSTVSIETTDGFVDSKPEWFFVSRLNISMPNEAGTQKTAYMMQEIRQLKIRLTETNGNIGAITNVKSTLSGLANSMDNVKRTISGTPVNVEMKYERHENKMETSIRLMGIFPLTTQKLITEITIDGEVKIIESDLTGLLRNFNINKSTPLTLNANLDLEMSGTEPGFSASIEDWEETSEDIEVD